MPQPGRGVAGSYNWAQLGVRGDQLRAVLGQPIAFFAPPGSTAFERVELPPTGRPGGPLVLDAGAQGFDIVVTEMGENRMVPTTRVTVLHSGDGRSWTASGADEVGSHWLSAAGRVNGRLTLVGSSGSGAAVMTRADTGGWTSTALSGLLGPDAGPGVVHVVSAGIGPLGIAAVVVPTDDERMSDAGPERPSMRLLISRDGTTLVGRVAGRTRRPARGHGLPCRDRRQADRGGGPPAPPRRDPWWAAGPVDPGAPGRHAALRRRLSCRWCSSAMARWAGCSGRTGRRSHGASRRRGWNGWR